MNEQVVVFKKNSKTVLTHESFCEHYTYIVQENAEVLIMHKPAMCEKTALSIKINIVAGNHSNVMYALAFRGPAQIACQINAGGAGSMVSVRGAYIGSDNAHIDITTEQLHENSQGQTSVLFKGLLGAQSSSIYKGNIAIKEKAAGSLADQSHQVLLASAHARSLSIPSLEILTNDVQCKHGSASGPFDEQTMHYLMSRGFSANQANALLLKGFFADVFNDSPTSKNFYDNWIDENIRESYE